MWCLINSSVFATDPFCKSVRRCNKQVSFFSWQLWSKTKKIFSLHRNVWNRHNCLVHNSVIYIQSPDVHLFFYINLYGPLVRSNFGCYEALTKIKVLGYLKSQKQRCMNMPVGCKKTARHIHKLHFEIIFTRGQFWPSGIVVACVCVSVSLCQSLACPRDNSRPVQARITKFGTQVYKTLVKIPIVLGGDWSLPSRSNLPSKSKFTPFWACPSDNLSPIQARTTKFGPEVQNTLVKNPIVLGVDWAWHVKLNSFSKSCWFASLLRLWNICETCKKGRKRSLFHILNGWAQICSPTRSCHGLWNSRVVSLVRLLLARRLAMDFGCFCRLSPNYTCLTHGIFYANIR